MIRHLFILVALVAMLGVTGCAYKPPQKTPKLADNSAVVSGSSEIVQKNIVRWLEDNGWSIDREEADRIQTGKFRIPITSDMADCGSYPMMDNWLKGVEGVGSTVSGDSWWQIAISPEGEETKVESVLRFTDIRAAQAVGNEKPVNQICVSLGVREQELLESLK